MQRFTLLHLRQEMQADIVAPGPYLHDKLKSVGQ